MGNIDVARDLFSRGLRRCPEHPALWTASAKLESEAGRADRARQLFRDGVEKCGQHAALLVAWAYFEMHQGKIQRAEQMLAHAGQQVDGHRAGASVGEMYHVRALLNLKMGRPLEARTAVDEGLVAAPTHAPLYRVLGAMQDLAGDVEGARASFTEGLRLNGDALALDALTASPLAEAEKGTPLLVSLGAEVEAQALADLLIALRALPGLSVSVLEG